MITITDEPFHWSAGRKLAVRFFLLFFVLYITLNPNGVLPYSYNLYEKYIIPFHKLAFWIGKSILHLKQPITVFTNGSGDTSYDYVIALFIIVVSVVATLIWSLADRKARSYNKLFYWLTVIVRYYVAITMLSYGFVKVIKLQFPFPEPNTLIQAFGDASPMRLAWTYMGYSSGFNLFTGLAEISCAVLLLFRRTATLGALVGLVVAGNIMAINYSFDVPVKLLSTMLTIMCLFLLCKDAVRLINFFLLNKPAAPANLTPHTFKRRWANITALTLKYLLIFFVLASNLENDVQAISVYGEKAPKPALYGIYNVKTFIRNKDTVAPIATDTLRWKKLVISLRGVAQLKMMNDSSWRYNIKTDTVQQTVTLSTDYDKTNAWFRYFDDKRGNLTLKGYYNNDSLKIVLVKYDLKNFRLINRGFHWINEYPFNR